MKYIYHEKIFLLSHKQDNQPNLDYIVRKNWTEPSRGLVFQALLEMLILLNNIKKNSRISFLLMVLSLVYWMKGKQYWI